MLNAYVVMWEWDYSGANIDSVWSDRDGAIARAAAIATEKHRDMHPHKGQDDTWYDGCGTWLHVYEHKVQSC